MHSSPSLLFHINHVSALLGRINPSINDDVCAYFAIESNIFYILLSSHGADTDNDECVISGASVSATNADGSSARARENECVALPNK